jgi:hypothetical protein
MLLGSKVRLVRGADKDRMMDNNQNCDSGADNLTAIYETII